MFRWSDNGTKVAYYNLITAQMKIVSVLVDNITYNLVIEFKLK